MKVYSTIMRRFVAVFCAEECTVEKTEITISVGDLEDFSLKGTVIVNPGWTKYDDYTKKDKILPKLDMGDVINIYFKPVEKETNPPKHYTIETLNNYLKNPFKEERQRQQKMKMMRKNTVQFLKVLSSEQKQQEQELLIMQKRVDIFS